MVELQQRQLVVDYKTCGLGTVMRLGCAQAAWPQLISLVMAAHVCDGLVERVHQAALLLEKAFLSSFCHVSSAACLAQSGSGW